MTGYNETSLVNVHSNQAVYVKLV